MWWLVPWQGGRRPVAHPPVALAAPVGTTSPVMVPKAAEPTGPGPKKEIGAMKAPPPMGHAEALRSQTGREGRDTASREGKQAVHGAPTLLPDRQVPPAAPPKTAQGPVLPERAGVGAINLPPDAGKDPVPPLKVSLHSYGPAPESRLVRINDRTLREGDVLPPDIKVEEITSDGVILSRDGQRFHLGIDQGR